MLTAHWERMRITALTNGLRDPPRMESISRSNAFVLVPAWRSSPRLSHRRSRQGCRLRDPDITRSRSDPRGATIIRSHNLTHSPDESRRDAHGYECESMLAIERIRSRARMALVGLGFRASEASEAVDFARRYDHVLANLTDVIDLSPALRVEMVTVRLLKLAAPHVLSSDQAGGRHNRTAILPKG
jgi:hypothetical protein